MNNCNFTGRLTKDPELKYTTGGTAVLDFTLAVDRRDKDRNTDFIPCKAWTKTAEAMSAHLRKGSLIEVNGRLESRSYEKEGQKRYVYEIMVNSFGFLESKKEQTSEQADQADQAATAPTPPPVIDTVDDKQPFDVIGFEESLPFDI